MKAKFSGYWIFIGSATVGMAVLAYFKGAAMDPSPVTRVIGVLLIGAALLLARGGLMAAWRKYRPPVSVLRATCDVCRRRE